MAYGLWPEDKSQWRIAYGESFDPEALDPSAELRVEPEPGRGLDGWPESPTSCHKL